MGSVAFQHKHDHDQYGTEVLNTIHGYDEHFWTPNRMRKHLGSMNHKH